MISEQLDGPALKKNRQAPGNSENKIVDSVTNQRAMLSVLLSVQL